MGHKANLRKAQQGKLDRAFLKIYREDSLREHDGKCTFCFEPLTYKTVTADHLKPKSKGGSNTKDNIVPACFDCNQAKGSMSDKSFRNLIKHFPTGRDIKFIMAWSRRRINITTDRSINRVKTYFGI